MKNLTSHSSRLAASPALQFVSPRFALSALVALGLVALTGSAQAETWNTNTGNWSLNTNWTPNTVPDGIGAVADLSGPIANTSVITIDTTPRTVGTLLFGSSTNAAAITLAASGGGTLTFDNGASAAVLTMANPARGLNISVPLIVSTGKILNINVNSNYSGGGLNFSGTISGGGTIVNQGTGSNGLAFNGLLDGVTLRQNSATSAINLGASPQGSMKGLEIISGTVFHRNSITATDGITLDGGKLSLGRDNSITFTSSAVTVTADSTMESGRHSAAGAGTVGTMGGLSIGNQTLTVQPLAANAAGFVAPNGGTAGFNFGATSLTGTNATFNVVNNISTGTAASLQLGAITQTGTSGVIKTGSGTLIIAGATSFSGATTVSGGTLRVGATGTLANTSGISVTAGATIENANASAITRVLTLQEGASLLTSAAGSSFNPTALTLTGDLSDGFTAVSLTNTAGSGLVKSGSFELTLSNVVQGTYNLTSGSAFSGAFTSMTINGNALNLSGSDWTGTIGGLDYSYFNSTNVLTVVPEPATFGLLAAAVLGMVVLRRRWRV